jgi:hypothetical protein
LLILAYARVHCKIALRKPACCRKMTRRTAGGLFLRDQRVEKTGRLRLAFD